VQILLSNILMVVDHWLIRLSSVTERDSTDQRFGLLTMQFLFQIAPE